MAFIIFKSYTVDSRFSRLQGTMQFCLLYYYIKWEVVSGPDETPLRLNVSVFQRSQFFGIIRIFFLIWALVLEFVSVWIYVSVFLLHISYQTNSKCRIKSVYSHILGLCLYGSCCTSLIESLLLPI